MPRCREHREVGAICGGAGAWVRAGDQQPLAAVCEAIGGVWGGYIGGQMPDWLEPAFKNPRHRKICHSELSVAALYQLGKKAVRKWETFLRDEADRLEAAVDAKPLDGWKNFVRLILATLCRVLAGFLVGFIAGYVSHIVLDANTKMSIGLLGILKNAKVAI